MFTPFMIDYINLNCGHFFLRQVYVLKRWIFLYKASLRPETLDISL